jgi:hypothetical protein
MARPAGFVTHVFVLFTVTMMSSVATHPVVGLVAVRVYVVVVLGVANGLASVGLLKPEVGLQEYVIPATEVIPMVAPVGFETQVMERSAPALATGKPVTTVTMT